MSPRPVEARGSLSDAERSTVELFERVSPSVVQVVVRASAGNLANEAEGLQSGTGFVWDRAGHVVTNDHVLKGAEAVVVRLASGETLHAAIVGMAPNYDLGVIRLEGARNLPPPVAVGA